MRSRALAAEHEADPERRLAQRGLADELTALVHGEEAASAAAAAAEVLFGGDPTTAIARRRSRSCGGEVPSSAIPAGDLVDLVALLDRTGVAASKGEARRSSRRTGIAVNGRRTGVDDERSADLIPLHGRYLLLAQGRSTYHLVEIVP